MKPQWMDYVQMAPTDENTIDHHSSDIAFSVHQCAVLCGCIKTTRRCRGNVQDWRAILYFSEALKANPDHVNAYLQRGFCYSLLKQYANAAADFSSVITRQKDHVWAYISRGSAYNKLEQFDLALNDFNKVLELEPKNEEGYNNRGWAYKGKDDMKSACKDWKTSKKFGNAEAKIILINTGCK